MLRSERLRPNRTTRAARPTARWLLLSCLVGSAGCARAGSDPAPAEQSKSEVSGPAPRASAEATSQAPSAPVPRDRVATHEPPPPSAVTRVTAEGQLGPGRGTLLIDLQPPGGGKLAVGAPLRVSARGKDLAFPEPIRTQLDPAALPLRLPVVVSDGATEAPEVDLTYYWCSVGDSGSCHPVRARLVVELDLSGSSAGGEAHLVHRPES